MMSGSITTDLVPGKTGSITIPIKRLDAKIRFNIVSGTNTYGNVIFTPRSWRVVRAPKKIMPFSATETDIFNDSSSDFFSLAGIVSKEKAATMAKHSLSIY